MFSNGIGGYGGSTWGRSERPCIPSGGLSIVADAAMVLHGVMETLLGIHLQGALLSTPEVCAVKMLNVYPERHVSSLEGSFPERLGRDHIDLYGHER